MKNECEINGKSEEIQASDFSVQPTVATNKSNLAIPKQVHFIWLGNLPIPSARGAVIKAWIDRLKPLGFEFYFWVDKEGTPASVLSAQKKYLLSSVSGDLHIVDVETLKNIAQKNRKLSDYWEIFRYENDRLRANYGAASDLLRYLILYLYGGIYFDSDVKPPVTKEDIEKSVYRDESFWRDTDHYCVYRQGSASDILASSQGNPGLGIFLDIVKQKYDTTQLDSKVALAYLTELRWFYVGATLERTGSQMLNRFYAKMLNNDSRATQLLDIDELRLREKLTHAEASWIGMVDPIV